MNNFRVETYNNPIEYYNDLTFSREELHIVGSSELAMHLKDRQAFKIHNEYICTFADIQNELFKEWNDPINQLELKVIIRELIEKNCIHEIKQKSLVTQINTIHREFKSYIESGIREIDDELCEDYTKKIIRKVFNEFSKCELVEELYHSKRNVERKEFIERLNAHNKQKKEYGGLSFTINKIYFYNLTFIDAPRYAFFKMLDEIGFQVIFRIPEHEEISHLSAMNEINTPWKELYSFIPREMWTKSTIRKEKYIPMSKYAYFLNGEDAVNGIDKAKLSFKKYIDTSEFKRQLIKYPLLQSNKELDDNIKEQIQERFRKNGNWNHNNTKHRYYHRYLREYITFSKDNYNKLFNGTVLDYKDKDLSIMNFNEGKFLIGLYRIEWDEKGNEIKLEYNDYFDCITSGWIEIKTGDKYISGNKAVDILSDLKPYLQGVKTLSEIIDRLEKLTWLHEFHNTFNEISKETIEDDKVKEYLHNPLKVFSYSSNERYSITVKQLIDLTKKFKRIIEDLIPKSNMIDMSIHKKKLAGYWKDISYISSIIKKYFEMKKKITLENDKEFKIFTAKNYIYLNTINSLVKISNIQEEITLDEAREYMNIILVANKRGFDYNYIKLFDQLEGIMVNGTLEVYITDLSEKSINKYIKGKKYIQKSLSNEKYLEKDLSKNNYSQKDREIILQCIKASEENALNFIKYYFAAMTSYTEAKVEISWIDGVNDNDQQSSLFKILSTLYSGVNKGKEDLIFNRADQIKQMFREKLGSSKWPNNNSSLKSINNTRGKDTRISIHEDIAPSGWLDLDLCPQKFFYSNMINHNPVYSTDFHQRLAFAGLGKLIKSQNNEKHEVREYLYPLFPQWDKTLKDNLIDTAYYREIRKEYKFKNIYFPYYIRDLQILRSKIYDNNRRKHRNGYRNMHINTEGSIKAFIKDNVKYDKISTNKGDYCDMCPHNMICTKGEFAIERTHRY